jgi:hypothetical protein
VRWRVCKCQHSYLVFKRKVTCLESVYAPQILHPNSRTRKPTRSADVCLRSLFWLVLAYFSKAGLCVCMSVYSLPPELLNAWTDLYETWYVYRGTWAHLNSILHKSLPSVCVCVSVCVYPSYCCKATALLSATLISVIGNGSETRSHGKYYTQ